MKPLEKYVIYNPYEHTRALSPNMINDFNNAIERQKELLKKSLNIKIEGFCPLGRDHYCISFCLSEFERSYFAMNWEVVVKKDVLLKWIENYCYLDVYDNNDHHITTLSASEYLEDNEYEVAKVWLEEQDLNTLEYV